MKIVNGIVQFDDDGEKKLWETTIERPITEIPPDLLRQLGEARVKELTEEGYNLWAGLVAKQITTIPQTMLH